MLEVLYVRQILPWRHTVNILINWLFALCDLQEFFKVKVHCIFLRSWLAVIKLLSTSTPKFSNLNTVFWIWCSDWLTFSNSKNFMSEWVIVVKCHLSNVSAISWREHVNYVSPSNEGRHIVLVWFFLLLLLSEACPNHNFFVFPDRSIIFGMWVHDHKAVCRVP
jgi:hypothetical protein